MPSRKRKLNRAWAPPDVGDDEHIIQRLGWALIRQWNNVPAGVQNLIREQAVFTDGRQMTFQLDRFIRKHAGGGGVLS